jgi:hypothetical protein
MPRFRKKPVVIEARQYTAESCRDICRWADLDAPGEGGHEEGICGVEPLAINTLEGMMEAQPGDWIIRGIRGEFYPCKPDVFAATYEPVED